MFYMSDDDSINSDKDEYVQTLAEKTLRRIDKAFNAAVDQSRSKSISNSPRSFIASSRQRSQIGTAPGGFVVEDEPGGFVIGGAEEEAGGFILEEEPEDERADIPHFIPLSLVPAALQLLDLQPDDAEVLEVFKNAASGWGAGASQEEGVSRKDFRAVCAVLLGDDADDDASARDPSQGELDDENGQDLASNVDLYMEEDDADDAMEVGSDTEYTPSSSKVSAPKRSARRKRKRASSSSDEDIPKVLSARQKQACRKAFSLFFTDVLESDPDLENKKIMIRDISRVTDLLKEKLTAEDIVEMIELFSTTRDKSISFTDFEQIMIAAKLA